MVPCNESRSDPCNRYRNESGAATVMVMVLTFALVVIAWGAGLVVSGVVAHRVAQNAADLAALAGAERESHGGPASHNGSESHGESGCASAAEVAQVNRARLVACVVDGSVVTVEVVVTTTFGIRADLHARARAGPAERVPLVQSSRRSNKTSAPALSSGWF